MGVMGRFMTLHSSFIFSFKKRGRPEHEMVSENYRDCGENFNFLCHFEWPELCLCGGSSLGAYIVA